MRQFEIWWADLPAPTGRRPVLLLTRDDGYSYLNKFIAAEITSTTRNIAVEVPVGPAEGLPTVCVANCDNLRMVSKVWLTERAGVLQSGRWIEVRHAMGAALGWRELTDI
jgi:mRNA interferase MazF